MNKDFPDAHELVTRDRLATLLTAAGFPIKPRTLATLATRGGGPPYRLFGSRPLYHWGDAIRWARSRLSVARCTTSEHREAAANPPSSDDDDLPF
jgi:hypothetical protein